jgi:hypothetical protein
MKRKEESANAGGTGPWDAGVAGGRQGGKGAGEAGAPAGEQSPAGGYLALVPGLIQRGPYRCTAADRGRSRPTPH